MASMLEALRRIEARTPRDHSADQPGTPPEDRGQPAEKDSPLVEEPNPPGKEPSEVAEEVCEAREEVSEPAEEASHRTEKISEPTREVSEAPLPAEVAAPPEGPTELDPRTTALKHPTDDELRPLDRLPSNPPPHAPVREGDRRGWDLANLLARPIAVRDRPYRDLAANILSQLQPGGPSSLLFAAASDRPGKTPTALVKRLATVLAGQVQGGVLAADLDLRRPTLAEQFNIQAERGVADVLLDTASWQEVVRPSGVEGLAVLPGREFPASDATAFGSMRPVWLLDELRRQYRLVLLDAGRLRPEELTPWARFCEGTYLVVRLGETTVREARRAATLLGRTGARVLGSVLTVQAD